MYDNLNKYLDKKGLKITSEENIAKVEVIKAEFKTKEKLKALTQAERLDRIEKILGIQ